MINYNFKKNPTEHTSIQEMPAQDLKQCHCCAKILKKKSEYIEVDGLHFCKSCQDTQVFKCPKCGNMHAVCDSKYLEGARYCYTCFISFPACYDCHKKTTNTKKVKIEGESRYVCKVCEGNLNKCQVCGDYTFAGGPFFVGVCNKCKHDKKIITSLQGYSSLSYYCGASAYVKQGIGNKFIGVELELENLGTHLMSRKCSLLLKELTSNKKFNIASIKYDGSLDNGIEVVTHPLSQKEFSAVDWCEFFDIVQRYDYGAKSTTGLHVHISRESFGREERQEQLNTLAKFLYFFAVNHDTLKTLSNRTVDTFCEPLHRAFKNRKLSPEQNREALKKNMREFVQKTHEDSAWRELDRHSAINLNNWNSRNEDARTVEVRLAGGVDASIALVAWVDLILTALQHCKRASWESLDNISVVLSGLNPQIKEYYNANYNNILATA